MFKEIKHIASDANQIKNQIELRRITENARIDRSETCFGGSSRQTWKEYLKGAERAKKSGTKMVLIVN